jgi:hypothetical protein
MTRRDATRCRIWGVPATVLALTLLEPKTSAAQAPAIQHYGGGPWTPVRFGEYSAPGFFFQAMLAGLEIGSLSYFNPDFMGGASSLPGGYAVTLYTVQGEFSYPGTGNFALTPVLSAGVSAASSVSTQPAGAPGAFWSTALPSPFALAMNTTYAILAIRNYSLDAPWDPHFPGTWAYSKFGGGDQLPYPLVDPRISYLGSGYAPRLQLWAAPNVVQWTGASFNLTAPLVTPEPGTMGLVALGLGGLAAWKRRRRKGANPSRS